MIRLDKYLADAGTGTRSEVKKLIKNKLVTVNGVVAVKPEQKLEPQTDIVCVKGIPVSYEQYTYLLLHKPAGYVTARTDDKQTVMELLPPNLAKNLSPVGRLDKDTEGLLFITNDGALNHHLMSPAHHVEKTYYVILNHEIPSGAVELFANGVDIGDAKPTLPAKLTICSADEPMDQAFSGEQAAAHAFLTISEGRYHQVKRMFSTLGCEVVYLKRIALGPLRLGELQPGEYRRLSEEEVAILKNL